MMMTDDEMAIAYDEIMMIMMIMTIRMTMTDDDEGNKKVDN